MVLWCKQANSKANTWLVYFCLRSDDRKKYRATPGARFHQIWPLLPNWPWLSRITDANESLPALGSVSTSLHQCVFTHLESRGWTSTGPERSVLEAGLPGTGSSHATACQRPGGHNWTSLTPEPSALRVSCRLELLWPAGRVRGAPRPPTPQPPPPFHCRTVLSCRQHWWEYWSDQVSFSFLFFFWGIRGIYRPVGPFFFKKNLYPAAYNILLCYDLKILNKRM